jgi:soluble lytic murein transglycosylase-like protein
MLKFCSIFLSSLSFVLVVSTSAQTVYVYKDQNGASVISDFKSLDPRLKLVKSYTPVSPIQVLGSEHYDLASRRLDTRSTEFDQAIFDLADAFHQDRALIKAIVQIESSFDPQALSPKGAQGLMQLMPATADSYNVSNPYDAHDNLRGGIAFFADLMRRYQNDVRLALAAYNAGETAVAKYQGIPPYPETQAYVKYVLQLHKNYQRHPHTYS